MGRLVKIVAVALAGLLALGVAVMAASELGGEVVALHTTTADGELTTRVWVVDLMGQAWLRAGRSDNAWLLRIDANPDVVVERGGVATRFRAVPVRDDPVLRDRIHALMREHYTWADRVVSLMRDGSKSVPIRLDTVEVAKPD